MQPTKSDLRHRRIFSSPVESPKHQDTDTTDTLDTQYPPLSQSNHGQSHSVDSTRRIPRSHSFNTRLNVYVISTLKKAIKADQSPFGINRPTSVANPSQSRTRSTPIKSKMPFLSSITAFFSPSTDHGGSGSKRATMNSTFDAFSLPTTSHTGLGNPLREVVSLYWAAIRLVVG
jgi:hypothetical protein